MSPLRGTTLSSLSFLHGLVQEKRSTLSSHVYLGYISCSSCLYCLLADRLHLLIYVNATLGFLVGVMQKLGIHMLEIAL